jgi:hypothetical protein
MSNKDEVDMMVEKVVSKFDRIDAFRIRRGYNE